MLQHPLQRARGKLPSYTSVKGTDHSRPRSNHFGSEYRQGMTCPIVSARGSGESDPVLDALGLNRRKNGFSTVTSNPLDAANAFWDRKPNKPDTSEETKRNSLSPPPNQPHVVITSEHNKPTEPNDRPVKPPSKHVQMPIRAKLPVNTIRRPRHQNHQANTTSHPPQRTSTHHQM